MGLLHNSLVKFNRISLSETHGNKIIFQIGDARSFGVYSAYL